MQLFVVISAGVMLLGMLSLVVITAGTGAPSAGKGKGRQGLCPAKAFALAGAAGVRYGEKSGRPPIVSCSHGGVLLVRSIHF